MASDSDDADFFDKLVDDDDDDQVVPPAAAAQAAYAAVADISSLSLADDAVDEPELPAAATAPADAADPPPALTPPKAGDDVPAVPSDAEVLAALPEVKAAAVAAVPKTEAVATPEGGSPGSGKAVRTTVKQVQWSVFGADSSAEADPFGDLLADRGGGDSFFGVSGAQVQEPRGSVAAAGSVGAAPADHGFFSGVGNNAISQPGWGACAGGFLADGAAGDEAAFFGASVVEDQGVQTGSVVATSGVGAADHGFFNGVDSSTNSSQSYMGASAFESADQNTNVQSEWASGSVNSSEPNYLENRYPGWMFDEATQNWYQVPTTSAQGFADYGGAVTAVGSDNVQQLQQQLSGSYMHNSSQAGLETIAEEGGTTVMTWGQDQSSAVAAEYPPNMLFYAEYPGYYFDTNTQDWYTLESYQQSFAQVATATAASDAFVGAGHNVGNAMNSQASNFNQQNQWQQSSYSSHQHTETQITQQANTEPSEPSTNYRTGINTFVPSLEPSMNHSTSVSTFMPSTSQYSSGESHQVSHKGFEPTSYQNVQKGFEPYKSNQSTFTNHDSGYKVSEPSTGHQGFKPVANNHKSTGFVPSTGHQIAHREFEPSKDNQAYHVAHEPSVAHGYVNSNGFAEQQTFVPSTTGSMYQTQTHIDPAAHMHLTNNYLISENSMNFAQQQPVSQQFGYSPHQERSSAGRPPHALFAFGFGGKLVVMKETSSMTTSFDSGNQGNSRGMVSIHNISEIVADKIDQSSITNGSALGYFHALCRRPIPGPLVGGSPATKDVSKWLDEIIGSYESSAREFQGGDVQKLLVSLLKISYQHYGKLRSSFGSDPLQEGMDGPDTAVTTLFSSCNSNSAHIREYGAITHCMKNIPSENQIQATAQNVQSLLVSGRRKDALQYAQEGQLWGPALVLALQLGDKFYADTVKKMAYSHFMSGSPLRTLCLLIAGQPADVFHAENPIDANYGTLHRPQEAAEGTPKGMLDDWQQNLAIITANRTKGDDLVITHLGDCLWKEKNEVAAAHSCYLVAELNIDAYSETARMCLLGADHLRCPRTFTSPEAIQRTELYEYAKVLGNSQYILLPFQPYKLVYAYMLAEVGKISDSLRYCQASLKVLKASGRAPELEAWKQLFSSLEERIRTHQQGGYGTNLAPAKLVGKLFTSLDKSLSRMMGTQPTSLPPLAQPMPPLAQGSSTERDLYSAPPATNFVNNNQSATPMSFSASEQSMSDMTGNSGPDRKGTHNRSVSEPDFNRAPQQGTRSDNPQSTSGSGNSRFGWLLQKTMGLVSKSPHQAKLGEQNKFYYDEKLKRWVEQGAEVPAAEEPPLPPPPTKASFQNGVPDYNLTGPSIGGYTANGFAETKPPNPSELMTGMPPMPPSQNQFSARGRAGVRSRYVDTFNKGGAATAASYNKPAMPSMKPLPGAGFFVPTPAADEPKQTTESTADVHSATAYQDGPSSSPAVERSFASPPPPLVPMQSSIQRHPSMDNILTPSGSGNSSFSKSRAASWSGTYSDQLSTTAASRSPDGQTMQSPVLMPPGRQPSHSRSHSNSSIQLNGLGEDLQEVEL